jgi:hypothetical protein
MNKLRKYLILWIACSIMLSACASSEVLASSPTQAGVTSQTIPTSTLPASPIEPTATSKPGGCKTIHTIAICIQNIQRTDLDTQVKLKILVESNMVTGSGNSFIFPDDEHGFYPVLLDEQGRSYTLMQNADNNWAQYSDSQRVYFQTLHFQPVPADMNKLTVSLPMVAVDSPSNADGFQFDLGTNPQPGKTLALDVTTIINGQTFHFVKAEFEGDGVQALRVTLYTDPLNLPEDIVSITPMFGDHKKGVVFGAKQGINGLPLRIFADLVIPPGKSSGSTSNTYITGALNLKVDRVTYWFRGPFEISFQFSS